MLIGTMGGGLLGRIDLALPYLVRSGILVGVFLVAFFTMHDLGFRRRTLRLVDIPAEMKSVAEASIAYGWRRRSVRLLMGVSFLQLGFLTWGFYAWQPYFLRLLGHDAVWVAGVVAAAMALSTIVGNAVVDWFSQFCGRRTTLLLWAAGVQTVAAIGVGLAGSFWLAVIFFIFVAVAVGVTGPVKQAYIHEMVPSGQRASVISFDSMVGNAGGVLGQSGLGYLSRARSIEEGYVAGGIATVLVFPLLIFLRSLGERTDIIVGKRAGRRATCAAQGLPQVAQVDAIAREAAG